MFLLPTSGAQALAMLVSVLFGLNPPLTAVQVLWINLVTAITLALALASEPAERGIMRRPPRRAGAPIVHGREVWFIVIAMIVIGSAALALFYIAVGAGVDVSVARTQAVTALALGQLAYLLNCRFLSRSSLTLDVFRGNPVVWWSAFALVALQVLFIYAPFMNDLFGSVPLSIQDWAAPAGLAAAIFVVIELLKAVQRSTRRSQPTRVSES